MNWTEIQELQTEGWGVAAHSINSSHLTTLSGEQRQEAFTEIKEVIQGNLSVTPIAFIYPGNQHNDTIDSECGEHYLICTGESSGDQQPYYSYKGSDLTGGVHRLLVDNETSIESFRRAVDSFYGLEVGYKMNENQGSVIYDFGDNSNNVSVDGASWENDNSLVSLNDVDYNVSVDSFTLSGEDYMFSWVNINWDYSNVRSLASNTGLTVTQVFIALIVLGFMAFGLKQWMDN